MVLSVQTSSHYLSLVPQTFILMLRQPLDTNCASRQTGIPGGKVTLHFTHSVISNSLWPRGLQHTRPPGLPIHHQPPEFTQTHVHWVGDAIQPSHPLLSPSPPTFNLSQHLGLFQWVSSSHQVAKILEFQLQHQSFQWIFRTNFLEDGLVGSPCSSRDSQESSPTPQFKSINSSVLSFLYSPTLPSIHELLEKL